MMKKNDEIKINKNRHKNDDIISIVYFYKI